MSVSLALLSPELLSSIVANIESQPTLCNLARCSRQLYCCTIPYLYRRVTILEDVGQGEPQNGQLRNLASLLIGRPDLARLVRYFTLHHVQPLDLRMKAEVLEESGEYLRPKAVQVDQAFKTAVSAMSLSKEEENNWLRKLSSTHEYHYDLILSLLFPALLEIKELVLDLKAWFNVKYLERIIRLAARRERPFDIRPPFEKLTVFVHSHNYRWEWQKSTGFIASLLELPAIKKISGSFGKTDPTLVEPELTDKNLIELDSSSSSLTSLDLTTWALSTANLCHILRAPKALKTFTYKVWPGNVVDFAALRDALGPQKNYLESLSFDYHKYFLYFDHIHPERRKFYGPMTSFVSFNNLKVFKIPALFLRRTDNEIDRHSLINIFPPSLETLHLTRFHACLSSLLEDVERLLAQKSPQQIPLLKKLVLEETESSGPDIKLAEVMWRNTQETHIGRLTWVAAAQGVSVDHFRDVEGFVE